MMRLLLQKTRFFWVVLVCLYPALADAQDTENASNDGMTKAPYAYMIDYNTGEVLLEKNADEVMEPASMTKMMTAYLVFDKLKRGELSMEDKLPVSVRAWKKGGSKMFVQEGSDVSVSDLLHGIIVQSGNDACIVVAEGIAGSEEAFAEEMNFVAGKIGLENSHFKNSTGWPDIDHVMTARDLVTLAKHLIEDFPEYYPMFAETEFTYNEIKQVNRNHLLSRGIGADGLKTGYTKRSGYGMVASAVQNGRRIILAINGFGSSKERIPEAERLLRMGFRDFKLTPLYKAGDVIDNAKVWMGSEDTVPLVIKENVEVLINRRDSKRAERELTLNYNSPLKAPIKKGDKVAELTLTKNGKPDRKIPLFAGKDVEPLSFFGQAKIKLQYLLLGG